MNAGALKKHVTIQKPVEVQDTYGGVSRSWKTHAVRWAAIEPTGSSERWRNEGTESVTTHRVRMRYAAGVTHDMRLAWNGRTFDIASIVNIDEANRELVLTCMESE